MDLDAFVGAHAATWRRLETLTARASRPRSLAPGELDELVDLYQRVATHLSVVSTSSPDPQLVARLSSLVARARGAVSGARERPTTAAARFVTVTFPAAVYVRRWWIVTTAACCLLLSVAVATWVARNPAVQAAIGTPEDVRQLVERDFEDYYSSAPASSFAARVFTNNVYVGALAFTVGALLCLPTVYVLITNFVSIGVTGGLMAANGRVGLFFGLITPHGLLELTAVWVAAAAGMRLGWRLVDPGPRRRTEAAGEEGRSATAVILGLVGVFFIAGLVEGFVTPSGLPTAARVGIGVGVEAAFVAYVWVLGGRAHRAGETGDLVRSLRGDAAPSA